MGPGIQKGAVYEHLVGNVDVTPTIIALAGVAQPPFMDGRSMLHWLLPGSATSDADNTAAAKPWRDRWLSEYYSVGAYTNDHSKVFGTPDCGGPMPRGPEGSNQTAKCVESEGVGDGNCYFIDSQQSNTWRALRILNARENITYVEYDSTWKYDSSGPTGAGLDFYELYDLSTDPYQINNLYSTTSDAKKTELHSAIVAYFACKGTYDTVSNCP
jgi:arylsulfatase A-like enzyme